MDFMVKLIMNEEKKPFICWKTDFVTNYEQWVKNIFIIERNIIKTDEGYFLLYYSLIVKQDDNCLILVTSYCLKNMNISYYIEI